MMRAMKVTALLAILGLAALLKLSAANDLDAGELETHLVAGPSRLQSTLGPDLTGEALDAYRAWSRRPAHFGAFAASDFGHYGWVSDYNSIQAAEASAIEICGVPVCRVFARSLPFKEAGEGELVVSRPAAEAFEMYLALPGAKAYAVHGNGAGGSWIRATTLHSAKSGALRECGRRSRSADGGTSASDAIGACRVVHAAR